MTSNPHREPCLTVWPEWAWPIMQGLKPVENRGWTPPRRLVGRRLWIHAGATIGGSSAARFQEAALYVVEATAEQAGVELPADWRSRIVRGALLGSVRLVGVDEQQRTGWDAVGAVHWRLEDPQLLPAPIPMRGAQRLWYVEPPEAPCS